jgi:hypothetical protein
MLGGPQLDFTRLDCHFSPFWWISGEYIFDGLAAASIMLAPETRLSFHDR